MIDYRIQTFIAVVEEGTLAKAAERCAVTQPAVSQQLKSLDDAYETSMFRLEGRRLVLTDAGKLLYEAAGEAAGIFSAAKNTIRGMEQGKLSYRIGATLTIGEYVLPSFLGKIGKKLPMLDFSVTIENTRMILERLRRREIDLALVEGYVPGEERGAVFFTDEMVRITGVGEKRSRGLILREQGSGTREYWETYAQQYGLTGNSCEIIMELGSLTAILAMVTEGAGESVISSLAAASGIMRGELQPLPPGPKPLVREFRAISTDRSGEALTGSILTTLKSHCRDNLLPKVDAVRTQVWG